MLRIPRIIHQTWKDQNIPIALKVLADSWLIHHPGWEYQFWTDDRNRAFIENHFPEFLNIYDGYQYNIQRVDAVRYFILFKYGGVYIDLDFECVRSTALLLENQDCVFSFEPPLHSKFHKLDQIISNAFIASIPGHFVLKRIIEDLTHQRIVSSENKFDDILESTGPFMINRVFKNGNLLKKLKVLSPKYLFPLTILEVEKLLNDEVNEDIIKKIADSYGTHYFMGSWWKKKGLLNKSSKYLGKLNQFLGYKRHERVSLKKC